MTTNMDYWAHALIHSCIWCVGIVEFSSLNCSITRKSSEAVCITTLQLYIQTRIDLCRA